MKHTKCYKPGYPRPMFVREEWQNLNGEWEFCFDRDNTGESRNFANGFPAKRKINVPFPYQAEGSKVFIREHVENVWYQRTVRFEKRENAELYLNFEGSDYHTKVWVNGCFVGEHKGAYARFSMNIESAIRSGDNLIVIKVTDTYSCRQPRGKQRWKDENFSCWYEDIAGIWKTVWAEYIPTTALRSVRTESNYDENSVRLVGKLSGDCKDVSVHIAVEFEGQKVFDSTFKAFDEVFYCTVDLTGTGHHFKRWTPENRELYDVEYEIIKDGVVTDRVSGYFGIVKYSTDRNTILCNNRPCYLKMVLDQGYFGENLLTPPDEQAVLKDVESILEAGFNGVRKHQKIEIDQFYYYCDILGLYVWCELPSPYIFDDEMMNNTVGEWLEILEQKSDHPSVMALVPFNESWGFDHIKDNDKAQNFTKSMYYLTKALRPERLVIANDGWEHTVGDLATLHCYCQEGERIASYLRDINDVLENKNSNLPMLRQVYSGGHEYDGQPVVISECAGIAFDAETSKGWGYGTVHSQEEFLKRYDSIVSAIKACKYVSGYCVTQLTDVRQEINGLQTENRDWKVDVGVLREINGKV